jgi:hypothetical protein
MELIWIMGEPVHLPILGDQRRAENIRPAIEWTEQADLTESSVSGLTVLGPDDIISAGAPGIAGFTREPPLFLERGDCRRFFAAGRMPARRQSGCTQVVIRDRAQTGLVARIEKRYRRDS